MSNPLISVIIPVYNIEQYLPKCLDSVLAQTYKNFEIIAIDDGSKDDSAKILREYSTADCRVKPVLKENGGVSSARNLGIDVSCGEYIYFLDGDDWIEPYTLERLLDSDGKFDVVQGAHVNSYADGTENCPINFLPRTFFGKKEILGSYFLNQTQESSCNKLYKKSAIGDTRFDEDLAVAEDSKFLYTVLKKASKLKHIPYITYHYFCREDSCTHEVLQEKHFAPLSVRNMQFSEICNDKDLFEKFLFSDSKLSFHLIKEILLDRSGKFKDRLPIIRNRVLRNKFHIFLSKYLGLRFKIGVMLLWLCPKLFYKIYSK